MPDAATLPPCPEAPEYSLRFSELAAQHSWLSKMAGAPQDPTYHAEGDVLVHTRMVCEALTRLDAWRALPDQERRLVFWAALLHDVAKPACTREEGGRLTSQGHSSRGERMARSILYRLGAPPQDRERVAQLVRAHQVPYFALDRDRPEALAIGLSQTVRCDLLALLAEADVRGRHCADQQRLIDNVELFRELCREVGCYDLPYPFASDESRVQFFRHPGRDPAYAAYDARSFEVVLLSGLPGAGKDTWCDANADSLAVISLDALRSKLNVPPSGPQGHVITAAKSKAREYLRRKTPFVWNATNVSRKIRRPLVDLFLEYDARVRIAYCEVPHDALLARNRSREDPVPDRVIDDLLRRWEVPDVSEAHKVEWTLGE